MTSNLLVRSVFFSLAFCFLYALDPSDRSWGAEYNLVLKFLPLIFVFFIFLVFVKNFFIILATPTVIPLLIFFLFSFGGAVCTIFQMNARFEDSYLSRALLMVFVFLGFVTSFSKKFEKSMAYFLPYLLLFCGFVVATLLIVWGVGFKFVDMPHIYHEEGVFVLVAMVCVYISRVNFLIKILCLIYLAAGLIFMHKNTAYIMLLVFIVFLLLKSRYLLSAGNLKIFVNVFFFNFFVLIAVFILMIVNFYSDILPSGSPGVRLNTYLQRWEVFLEHPFLGTLFLGSPMFELPTIDGSLFVPSHSDLLDIMAFGGLFSLIVFVWYSLFPVYRIMFGYQVISNDKIDQLYMLLSVFVFGVFLTLCVNPILNQVKLAAPYWFFVGFLVGRMRQGRAHG
ncbi:hypothetical protein [Neptunomonas phycophila]|uniref:hypothetical protein n=1 Tax=Neptunomonas phycophila TaxID=1572645 RepID=UPI0009491BFB|nr:hypothetical protein [Neptunomonas phycophila]